jgi:hypothetical protein
MSQNKILPQSRFRITKLYPNANMHEAKNFYVQHKYSNECIYVIKKNNQK